MNKKRQKFFEEFSENFADLFVETFAVRYGSIDDYDIFIEDFKKCMTLTRRKVKNKLAAKIVDDVSKKDKETI